MERNSKEVFCQNNFSELLWREAQKRFSIKIPYFCNEKIKIDHLISIKRIFATKCIYRWGQVAHGRDYISILWKETWREKRQIMAEIVTINGARYLFGEIFLSAMWLFQEQLWATNREMASLTWCLSLHLIFVTWSHREPSWVNQWHLNQKLSDLNLKHYLTMPLSPDIKIQYFYCCNFWFPLLSEPACFCHPHDVCFYD